MTLVRDLLDLPARISKGDYVQSLTSGLADPERTVDTYAVTPELVGSFDRALGLVGKALASGASATVYLDGSFGAGKSHFMAVLDLMLAGHTAPWRLTPLHPLRERHAFVGHKRLLQVPVHMLGPEGFEAKVFSAYIARARALHPDADLPLLFADAAVFDNAEQLRAQVGDAAFFARLNEGLAATAPSFFGAAAAAPTWDAARYHEARASFDPAVRGRLFTRLTATWLPAWTTTTASWVSAARGWNELSRHAASLGYDGVVLYLDEMILWLMGLISDPARMSEEFEKLVQVIEGQDTRRAVPLVVFIARQRRPENLVDATLVGTERATVFSSMAHHEGRFDKVELKDSTLRAIIPHRVCKPVSPAAAHQLDAAFNEAWARSEEARPWLAAGTAAQSDFRQVFPFSPALVDVLIALSDQLQRERTAVRILVELLVEHASDLELGQYVPVGDVFDLISGGEDAFDRAAQSAFQRARNLYLEKILPFLQATHGLTAETCQRLRPGHPVRIGCSGCSVRACRTDNRLVKTALLAALAPHARPLAQLTVRRLVHLNHGVYGAASEDLQIDVATDRLRKLAGEVTQVRLEGAGDPIVKVSLESVDTGPILERAESHDTRPRRRHLLRQLLWQELGIVADSADVPQTVTFHCTKRTGTLRFGNVRTLPDADLRCPAGSEWHVVIDYPFDDPGFSPIDDEQHLHRLRQAGVDAAHTLVWLPTFFSDRAERDLGDLCKLDHLLTGGNLTPALAHIPPDEHARARSDLVALKHRKETDLRAALAAAYGLRADNAVKHLLDEARSPTEHLVALDDGLTPRNPRELTAGKAITGLAEQLLEHRYPNHPHFQDQLTPQKASRLVDLLEKLVEAESTVDVTKEEEALLRDLAGPLGLCKVFQLKAEKLTRTIDRVEQQRAQYGESEPSVAQLRRWADPDGTRGLPDLAADLIGWVWAANDKRLLTDGGQDVPWPPSGKLPAGAQYVSPELPSAADFAEAIARAGAVFGETAPGKTLKAKNVSGLARALHNVAASAAAKALLATPAALASRWQGFGHTGAAPRARTAEVGAALIHALATPTPAKRIAALAQADLAGTSLTALGAAWRKADAVLGALRSDGWHTLDLLADVPSDDPRRAQAQALLQRVAKALAEDELNASLEAEVRAATTAAAALLKKVAPPSGWSTAWRADGAASAADALARFDELRAGLEAAVADAGPAGRVTWRLVVEKPEGSS